MFVVDISDWEGIIGETMIIILLWIYKCSHFFVLYSIDSTLSSTETWMKYLIPPQLLYFFAVFFLHPNACAAMSTKTATGMLTSSVVQKIDRFEAN